MATKQWGALKGRWIASAGVLLLAAILLVGCSSASEKKEASQPGGKKALVEVIVNVVEGSRLEFLPSRVEVPMGRRVRLTLDNGGINEHDLIVAGIPAEVEGQGDVHGGLSGTQHGDSPVAIHTLPGTVVSVVFTPTVPGTYQLICTMPGHKDAGMVGEMVVTA